MHGESEYTELLIRSIMACDRMRSTRPGLRTKVKRLNVLVRLAKEESVSFDRQLGERN